MRSDDDLREHTPLTALDEYLIHNNPNPVRVMWTTDARAYERVWFAWHDTEGHVAVAVGFGVYPNLDTAEAFVVITVDGVVRSVRSHRKLGLDRMDMTVGPFSFEIVRPFREWRLRLDDNEFGVRFDVTWLDTSRAIFDSFAPIVKPTGQQAGMMSGYEGFGTIAGWTEVDGERTVFEHSETPGHRDHHWGVRDGVGGLGMYQGGQWPFSGFWVQFKGWGLWGNRILWSLGSEKPGALRIAGIQHRLAFDSEGGMLARGEADILLPDGTTRTFRFERCGNQILPLRLGMYPSPQGGTPVGDVWPGMFVGDGVTTGERHDLNDPSVRNHVQGLDDLVCRFELEGDEGIEVAYGLAEPYHPFAQKACASNAPGYALL